MSTKIKNASDSTRQRPQAPRPELLPAKMRGGAAQARPGPSGPRPPRPELLPAKMRGEAGGVWQASAERWPLSLMPAKVSAASRGASGAIPASMRYGAVARVINKSAAFSKDKAFNQLIGVLGTDTLLQDFAAYHGRDGCKIELNGKRVFRAPSGWEGLVFDGAHWKGYDKDQTVYDSYKYGLQLDKTNNFCQSYACYLWATKGKVPGLVKGKYPENIQYMSKLWLGYFHAVYDSKNAEMIEWLEAAAGGATELKAAMGTLELLAKDAKLAAEMSQSKE